MLYTQNTSLCQAPPQAFIILTVYQQYICRQHVSGVGGCLKLSTALLIAFLALLLLQLLQRSFTVTAKPCKLLAADCLCRAAFNARADGMQWPNICGFVQMGCMVGVCVEGGRPGWGDGRIYEYVTADDDSTVRMFKCAMQ